MEPRGLKVDEPGFMLMVKGGKPYRWTAQAWALLPQEQKDEYDYMGHNGVNGEFVPIQHQAAPAQEVIAIKTEIPIKEEAKTLEEIQKEEPVEKVEAVVDNSPKKLEEITKAVKKQTLREIQEPIKKKVVAGSIEAGDRAGLKEWFVKNPNDKFYNKMPTPKMFELYESQK